MTVQAAGQNSGRGCFAAASGPTKQIGVVDPVSRQRLHQGVGDLGLADELSKRLRSISSIKSSHHALSLPSVKDTNDCLEFREAISPCADIRGFRFLNPIFEKRESMHDLT